MTSPHPDSHSAQDRSSTASSFRNSSSVWSATSTSSSSHQTSSSHGLAPLSTTFTSSSARPGSSSHSPRNPWSPASTAPPTTTLSRNATRSSSISTGTSPFSPPPSYHPPPGLSSARSRALNSTANSASSGAGSSTTRLRKSSPSIPYGSSSTSSTPIAFEQSPSSSVSSIVIAQITVLLSSLKERDKAKWESQVDQIKKLVDTHGMDVFTKYFRRLIISNAAQIWHSQRNPDTTGGSYPLLLSEVHKISHDPYQATRVLEAVEHGEKDGEVFRDFDLSGFMDHFKMKSFGKVAMASAFRKSIRTDLRTKADAILANNLLPFVTSVAAANPQDSYDDPSPAMLASIVGHLAQFPPRNWTSDNTHSLERALQDRYESLNSSVPHEISSALLLFELLEPENALVRAIQKSGPRGTERVDKCRALLESIELQHFGYLQVANALLFMIIAGNEVEYNPSVLISALREHRAGQRLDWQDVIHAFDRERIKITKQQFKLLFDALMPLAQEYENFDIQLLWGGEWKNADTQLAFLSAFLSYSQEELDATSIPRLRVAFAKEDFEDASEDVQAYAASAVRHPLVSLEGTKALFDMVFRSSETYTHAQRLGVIENVINPKMDLFVAAVSAVPKPWGPLQDQAIKQLLNTFFFKSFGGHQFVFHILWKRDRPWLIARLKNFWQQDTRNLEYILEHAIEHNWLDDLLSQKDEVSLELAALAHGRGFFDLEKWVTELSQAIPGARVTTIFAQWLKQKALEETESRREHQGSAVNTLTVKTANALLNFLADTGVAEDELVLLQRECIAAYPRLINYGEGFDAIIDENGRNGNELPPEAQVKMEEHFKHMYSQDSQVREVIEALQKYKMSETPLEQDVFACMIYGLVDEYNCFGQYPLDALATTAVLFGNIINYNLLSRTALKAALAMVLEAVRDYPPGESMYKFGLQALLHFTDRLSEWKIFCERLLQVPGLLGTEVAEFAEKAVREGGAALNGGDHVDDASEANVDSFLANDSKVADFNCLAVEPPLRHDYEDPDEAVKENVLFTLNNLSDRNLKSKFDDFKKGLQPHHNLWLANYLVDQRVKSQPNFQKLYGNLLDCFDDRELWAEVLRETFLSSFRLLNSETTSSSPSERTLLKNLAEWLGSITVARGVPIRYKNISFKDLLVEAHDTNRLPLVIPFTCRILQKAADSQVFRPPCAWTMEIVEILIELLHFAELKVQFKFDIENVCRTLGIDEKTTEPSTAVRSRPSEEHILPPAITDGPDGFGGDLSLSRYQRAASSERFSPSTIVPELADVPSMLKHNYTLNHASSAAQARMKQIFTTAVERALAEILAPVVERSVTIAAISAAQLVSKDFATEPDADRYEEAGHTTVRNLAGSLALVTSKEPLRTGVVNNIRGLAAREINEHILSEGVILMFVNDNLDMMCSMVEKAAENASVQEVDFYLDPAVQTRKNGSFQPPQLSRWANIIPEPFRQNRGGLNRDQMTIYEDFGQHGNISHNIGTSQDGGRQLPDVLQDQFSSMPDLQNPGESNGLRQPQHSLTGQLLPTQARPAQSMVNGYGDAHSMQDKVHIYVYEIVKAATSAADDYPGHDLSQIATVQGAWRRLQGLVYQSGQLSSQDQVALLAAEELSHLLFSESLQHAVIDVLAQIIRMLCDGSDTTNREVCIWLRQSEERIFNAITTVAFLKHSLLDYGHVDRLSASALSQRDPGAIDFLGKLVDGLLFCEPPAAYRSNFAHSMTALAEWLAFQPDFAPALELSRRLEDAVSIPQSPLFVETAAKDAQVEYIFEEWIKLQSSNPPRGTLTSFVNQMHARQTITVREDSARFFHVCMDSCISAFEREFAKAFPHLNEAYFKIDALAALTVLVVAHQGGENGTAKTDKIDNFSNIVTTSVLVIAHHYRTKGEQFNQKIFYRLFGSMMCEISSCEAISSDDVLEMTIAVGKGLALLSPQTFPGLSFAWLSLVAHRMFMPALLKATDDAGWNLFCDLLKNHLNYVGGLLRLYEISRGTKDLVRGTLETLLVLHHDFPEFLAENHFQLLSSVPLHCTQMRSLIISAAPTTYPDLPDPFHNGLQVDRLEENQRVPVIHGEFGKYLTGRGLKSVIDDSLQRPNKDIGLANKLMEVARSAQATANVPSFASAGLDDTPFNALVLYLVQQAEATKQESVLAFTPDAPEAQLFDTLAERLSPEGRYHLVGAMVNQLRWPNSHTYYFSYAIFHLFRPRPSEHLSSDIQMQIARVLLERLIAQRPHPWGLMVVMEELLKNRQYHFWELPFVKAAPDTERMFNSLFQQMGQN